MEFIKDTLLDAGATRLFLVLVLGGRLGGDGLPVGHAG